MTEAEKYGRGPWRNVARSYGFEWNGPLLLYWEVEGDPISDSYTPADMTADELLDEWVRQYAQGRDLVPIYWYVESPGHAKFERAPFQRHGHLPENWLSFYHWPVHAESGEPVNWVRLPVIDKLWNEARANKGGFIQEATGWKPSPLQSELYLPALIQQT